MLFVIPDPVVLIRAPSVAETKGAKSDAHRENAASPSAAAPPVDVKQHQAQAAAMKLQQVMKAYGAPPSAARSNHSRAGVRNAVNSRCGLIVLRLGGFERQQPYRAVIVRLMCVCQIMQV